MEDKIKRGYCPRCLNELEIINNSLVDINIARVECDCGYADTYLNYMREYVDSDYGRCAESKPISAEAKVADYTKFREIRNLTAKPIEVVEGKVKVIYMPEDDTLMLPRASEVAYLGEYVGKRIISDEVDCRKDWLPKHEYGVLNIVHREIAMFIALTTDRHDFVYWNGSDFCVFRIAR